MFQRNIYLEHQVTIQGFLLSIDHLVCSRDKHQGSIKKLSILLQEMKGKEIVSKANEVPIPITILTPLVIHNLMEVSHPLIKSIRSFNKKLSNSNLILVERTLNKTSQKDHLSIKAISFIRLPFMILRHIHFIRSPRDTFLLLDRLA